MDDGFTDLTESIWISLRGELEDNDLTARVKKATAPDQLNSQIVKRFCTHIVHLITEKDIVKHLIVHILVTAYGKTYLQKSPISQASMTRIERHVFQYITKYLSNAEAKERVLAMMSNIKISKRLINYFVVHYSAHESVYYYINAQDKSIVGEVNCTQTPKTEHTLIHINLYAEYKLAKQNRGCNNLHSPYARSVTVHPLSDYTLSEYNFWIWIDSVGAYHAFCQLEERVRAAKYKFDLNTRLRTRGKRQRYEIKSNLLMRKITAPPKF